MSRLSIPPTPHHTLPYGFYCLSHGRTGIDLSQDLSDATNRNLVHAMAPEAWRLIANIAPMGTVSNPTTYPGGGADYHVRLMADLDAGQIPKPRYLMGVNGGPYGASRPGSGSPTDPANLVTLNTIEGSTLTAKDWLARWVALGYDIAAVEFWNEPSNTSVGTGTHADIPGKQWFVWGGGTGPQKAVDWSNVHARYYRAAMAGALNAGSVLLGHAASGDAGSLNGHGPFDDIIDGQAIPGWPHGVSPNATTGAAFTVFTNHSYASGANSYQSHFNSHVYPTTTWGSVKHGYLKTFDYVRAGLNALGASAMPMIQSEWEPILVYGQSGLGVSTDALTYIIGANRQQSWNLLMNVVMDVARDESTILSTSNIGDQILYPPSTATGGHWVRGARYFGLTQIIGKFLKKYKNIVRVPMYTGDVGDCTWAAGQSPGLTAATGFSNAVQRHQAMIGYDTAGNLGIVVTDGGQGLTAEPITFDLPFDPVTATVTKMPAAYATFADAPLVPVSFTVSGRVVTTNAGGVPSFGGGDTMLFEFTTNQPPPVVTGLATYDSITVGNVQQSGRAQGYAVNQVVHGSNSTDKYGFTYPYGGSGVGTRLLKVAGSGSVVDEWVFGITINVPTDAAYGGGLGTGFNVGDPLTGDIWRLQNVLGDLGTTDVQNGVADSASLLPAVAIRYVNNHKIETTLTAPYSGAGTLSVLSAAGFDASGSQGFCYIGDTHKREKITFSGTATGQLTGGSAPSQSWPAGTKVTYWKGGLQFVLNHFNGTAAPAVWAMNSDPVPGQRLDLGLRIIFGRNDGSTVRQGFVELYEGSSTTKTVDVSAANILQRTTNWYRSPGNPHTQEDVELVELGPEVITTPATGGATGPWTLRMAATRVGHTVAEMLNDVPVLNVTRYLVTHGVTPNGTDIGTFNTHIAGLTDFGPGRINMNYVNSVLAGYDPARITAGGFQLSPALGGSTPTSPPTVVASPSISGVSVAGNTLTANDGTWNGSPLFGYQWQFSYTGQPSAWVNLPGAINKTLVLGRTHVGLLVRVIVTGTNSGGSFDAPSAATSVIPTATGSWIGNGDFATDTFGWEAFNGQAIGAATVLPGGAAPTLFRDTTNKPSGQTASLRVTTPGTLAFEGVRIPAGLGIYHPAGKARVYTLKLNLQTGDTLRFAVNTYDAATGQLIRTSTPGSVVTGTATGPGVLAADFAQTVQVTVPAPSADSFNTISATTGSVIQAITFRVAAVSYVDFVPAVVQPQVVAAGMLCKWSTARAQTYACPVSIPTTLGPNGSIVFSIAYDDRLRGASSVKLDNSLVLTRVGYETNPVNGPGIELWELLNPPSGPHTLNVTHLNPVLYSVGYWASSGVLQSGPVRPNSDPANSSPGSTSLAHSLPSSQNELVLAAGVQGDNGSVTLTPLAGQTDRWNDRAFNATLGGIHHAGTSKPGDATIGFGWASNVSSQPWEVVAISLVGVPAGTAPLNTAVPIITGTATQGLTLLSDDGEWSGGPTSISYEWQRDVALNGVFSAIPGATARAYLLQPADVGNAIRVVITASNQSGFATQASAATGAVNGVVPELVSAPVVTGPAAIGSTLHSTTGVFNNITAQYGSVTYSYQWQRDDSAYGDFGNVGGATNADYVLLASDNNYRFRCVVKATTPWGDSDAAVSNIIGPVGPAGILDSFNRVDEHPLSVAAGWAQTPIQNGSQLLEVFENLCRIRPGGLGNGQQWRLDVLDQNLFAELYIWNLPTVAGHGPALALRIQNPNDAALATAYEWAYLLGSGFRPYLFQAPATFTPLAAFNAGHVLVAHESIRFEAVNNSLDGYYRDVAGVLHLVTHVTDGTITGLGRIGIDASDETMLMDDFDGGEFNIAVPAVTTAPVITGTPVVGNVLSADDGIFDGSPSSFAHQWQRDVAGNGVFSDIADAITPVYLVGADDIGNKLRVRVVATNRAGDSAPAASAATAIATPNPPVNLVPPTIAGQLTVRSVLTSTPGTWTGDPLPALLYQWQRSADGLSGWVNIAGATGDTYTLVGADFGMFVQLVVTGDNGAQTPQASNVLGPIRRLIVVSSQGGPLPYLDVSGVEVGNAARTVEYLRAGLGATDNGHWELGDGDVCSVLYRTPGATHSGGLVGTCDAAAVFVSPADDPAPWYDATEPGSADFLGLILTDVKGYDGTGTRTVQPRAGALGGANFGARRHTPRTWQFQGVLVSTSDSGAEYGLRWLNSVLQGPTCEGCTTGDLTVRIVCPPPDCTDDTRGEWTSYEVALTDGPNETEPWSPGSSPGGLAGCRDFVEVTWTMVAGNSYLYKPASDPSPAEIVGEFVTCAGICDYLFGAPGPRHDVPVTVPQRGTVGAVYYFSSPSGMGPILMEAYDNCSDPLAVPVLQMQVAGVPVGGALTVDCARREVTVYTPDPVTGDLVASDGKGLIELLDGQKAIQWIEARDCDSIECFSSRKAHPCSQGGDTTVQVSTQRREG